MPPRKKVVALKKQSVKRVEHVEEPDPTLTQDAIPSEEENPPALKCQVNPSATTTCISQETGSHSMGTHVPNC